MEYRKDIQILRGIAVLMVIFFHLGIAGFNSGFLGVDVFFVISGYLMSVTYNHLERLNFFIRRARRLLPSYFAVVIFTLLIAVVVTNPSDYGRVSLQAYFATFFASNIGFWMEQSYFDKSAFKPLLHLWSLGVEIQFCLLLPLLHWVFKKVKISYPLIMVLSAALCFVVVGISPKTSFFWLPFRLWEFLVGFGVAAHVYKGRAYKKDILAWVGAASLVAIICIPFINIDNQALGFMRGHPGLGALLISLATATTLSFGIPERIEGSVILGPLEKIGGYSYSIYLAHFPVIVLFLYQPFSGTVLKAASLGQTAALIMLIICASAFLFRFVEQPFRADDQTMRWVIASLIFVIGIGHVGTILQRALTPEKEMLIYLAWDDRSEYRCGKLNRIFHPIAVVCEITEPIKIPSHRVLLVGNSHAGSIKTEFSVAGQDANVSVYFMIENAPLMDGGISPQSLVREAQVRHIDLIVLHYSPRSVDVLAVEQVVKLAKEENIRVSFIMPVPVLHRHIPAMLLNNIKGTEAVRSQSLDDYQKFNSDLIEGLAKIDYRNFKIYQVGDVFCNSACLLISDSGNPLYYDESLLTLTGSKMLRGVFKSVFADLSLTIPN